MMRKRLFLLLSVVLVACFASFYAYEGRANTETEETLPEEVNRPGWIIGDQWKHKITYILPSGVKEKKLATLLEVSRKEEFEGTECYVLTEKEESKESKGGSRRIEREYYYTLDLNEKREVSKAGDRVVSESKMIPQVMEFDWPLKIRKKWEVSYTLMIKDIRGKKAEFTVNGVLKEVVGTEKIEVPAGEFTTLKIIGRKNDTLVEECWYAPKAKWFVKKKAYLENGKVMIWELEKYDVN